METRKLQEVGGGTFTVSIPREWADEHHLEAGTDVHLYTHTDGSIVVRSELKEASSLAATTVEIDGPEPELVERALRAVHAAGFESVTLTPPAAFTAEQRRAARSVVRSLVGTEITVESDDEIGVRNFLDASDVSVRQAVVQLQFVAVSVLRNGTAALLDAEPGVAASLEERADEASRLADLVSRHFNRALCSLAEVDHLGTSRAELAEYCETARGLERVAAMGVSIGRAGERLAEPLSDPVAADVRAVADDAAAAVELAASAVLDGPDVASAHDALDACEETTAAVDALVDALVEEPVAPMDQSVTSLLAVARALDDVTRIAETGRVIAHVATRAERRAPRDS